MTTDADRLAFLHEMQARREEGHPETLHLVPLELKISNLEMAQLEAMAALQTEHLGLLIRRYLLQGLEADLAKEPRRRK